MAADNHKNVLKSLEKAVQAVEDVQMPLSEDHYVCFWVFYVIYRQSKGVAYAFLCCALAVLCQLP